MLIIGIFMFNRVKKPLWTPLPPEKMPIQVLKKSTTPVCQSFNEGVDIYQSRC